MQMCVGRNFSQKDLLRTLVECLFPLLCFLSNWVPRSTAMAMVGHRTEAVYRRYAIVDEAMLREGAARLAVHSGKRTWGKPSGIRRARKIGQEGECLGFAVETLAQLVKE